MSKEERLKAVKELVYNIIEKSPHLSDDPLYKAILAGPSS